VAKLWWNSSSRVPSAPGAVIEGRVHRGFGPVGGWPYRVVAWDLNTPLWVGGDNNQGSFARGMVHVTRL